MRSSYFVVHFRCVALGSREMNPSRRLVLLVFEESFQVSSRKCRRWLIENHRRQTRMMASWMVSLSMKSKMRSRTSGSRNADGVGFDRAIFYLRAVGTLNSMSVSGVCV